MLSAAEDAVAVQFEDEVAGVVAAEVTSAAAYGCHRFGAISHGAAAEFTAAGKPALSTKVSNRPRERPVFY